MAINGKNILLFCFVSLVLISSGYSALVHLDRCFTDFEGCNMFCQSRNNAGSVSASIPQYGLAWLLGRGTCKCGPEDRQDIIYQC